MVAYSQHLDWHFRMKRREKEYARKAQSRMWYFEREDWINSDEIDEGAKGKRPGELPPLKVFWIIIGD